MKRFPGWPRRLDDAIEAARERPFSWGSRDCALFAADVVKARTGEDLAASFRGRYSSRAEAVALLGARGGLEALVGATLGPALPTALLARRGDVVMAKTEEGPAVGVCCGAKAAFAGPQGLTFLPLAAWAAAWRI